MIEPKRQASLIAKLNLYLNFGLLGIATSAAARGNAVRMIQGDYTEPAEIAAIVAQQSQQNDIVFLSIPSCFAIEWAKQFLHYLSAAGPSLQIALGGRWVVGEDPDWLRRQLPSARLVYKGTAESFLPQLLEPNSWDKIESAQALKRAPTDEAPSFSYDYTLLDQFRQYQPSIEISRGCGFGCAFCVDAVDRLDKPKTPEQIREEIKTYRRAYNSNDIRFYFEASLFRPGTSWASSLRTVLDEEQIVAEWRCESRADVWSRNTLKDLHAAGLRVIDIGLDSADPNQLLRMAKTTDPAKYLHRANELLEWCRELGIWAKVNVLLYLGETERSLDRTRAWLRERQDCIKGVSINPLIVYRSDMTNPRFVSEVQATGATTEPAQIEHFGYCRASLSESISADTADDLGRELSREFMTLRDYFDLKNFSYFRRGVAFDDFEATARASDPSSLPFRIDSK
jgi:hypothetical protein